MAPRSWISTLLLLALAGAAWFFFAPAALPGGSATYAITDGISMRPLYHSDDLVILRGSGSYKVNDIVGYRNQALGRIVLHRIVAIDGTSYTFKGDNNDYKDAPVDRSDLIAKAWIHIPQGGKALKFVKQPVVALGLLVVVLLLAGGAGLTGLRRQPARPAREDAPVRERGTGSGFGIAHPQVVLAALGVVAAAFGVLALIGSSRASTKPEIVASYYTQDAKWSYSASAHRSAVYPTGRIKSGDTAFEKLVDGRVKIAFTYALKSGEPILATGKEQLLMRIEGDNLWRKDVVLVAPRTFSGPTTTMRTAIDIHSLKRLLLKVEKDTGFVTTSPYKITLTPLIVQNGRVGNQTLHQVFSPALVLRFDKVRLFPDDVIAADGSSPNALVRSQDGSGTREVPSAVDLKVATLSVPTARNVGLVGLLVALLLAALVALAMRRSVPGDEPSRIAAKYGDWLVPISALPVPSTPPTEVASFEALLSLADRADRSVMHYADGTTHSYFVKEDDVTYRYVAEEAPAEHPADAVPAVEPEAELLRAEPTFAVEPTSNGAAPSAEPTWAPIEQSQPAVPQWSPPAPTLEPLPPVMPMEELPANVTVVTPPPASPAPVQAPAAVVASGFVPESPETAYQPAPVSTPAPIVVPQHPLTAVPAAPAPVPTAPSVPAPAIVPLSPAAPAESTPEVALIRDTFLRPRPRDGGNGASA